jgi:hypothetical protein
MLITKIIKNQNIDFNGNFGKTFYQRVYGFIEVAGLKNAKIIDNSIK